MSLYSTSCTSQGTALYTCQHCLSACACCQHCLSAHLLPAHQPACSVSVVASTACCKPAASTQSACMCQPAVTACIVLCICIGLVCSGAGLPTEMQSRGFKQSLSASMLTLSRATATCTEWRHTGRDESTLTHHHMGRGHPDHKLCGRGCSHP